MKKLFLLLWLATAIGARAQSMGPQTINASGGSAGISGNTFEWSVAEMTVVSTYTSSGRILTQGVLQPKVPPAGINGIALQNKDVQVYPNPVQDELNLLCHFSSGGKLNCMLQDMTGKTILEQHKQLDKGNETLKMELHGIATGSYLLIVNYTQLS